jgi:hypothetical protein
MANGAATDAPDSASYKVRKKISFLRHRCEECPEKVILVKKLCKFF